MFRTPEDLIIAVIGILWVIATYFIGYYLGADASTRWSITLFTFAWFVLSFYLWRHNLITFVWPIFLGMLIACWTPYLDWIAIRDYVAMNPGKDVIILTRPWYASLPFKLVLCSLPVLIAYLSMWKRSRIRHKAA